MPLEYTNMNGIKVFNARGVYSIPMAEWAVLKILEILKKSKSFYKNQEQHKWEKHRDLLELTDKTVAIIGFGNVGSSLSANAIAECCLKNSLTRSTWLLSALECERNTVAFSAALFASDRYARFSKDVVSYC